MTTKMQAIFNATPPELRGQLEDVFDYLDSVARTGHVPEGSVAAFINRQHPAIRANLKAIKEAADTPRDRPFVPKQSDAERYDSFGFNADTAKLVGDALDVQDVMTTLQDRMGNDSARDPDPITTRDVLSEAYDMHTQGDSNG